MEEPDHLAGFGERQIAMSVEGGSLAYAEKLLFGGVEEVLDRKDRISNTERPRWTNPVIAIGRKSIDNGLKEWLEMLRHNVRGLFSLNEKSEISNNSAINPLKRERLPEIFYYLCRRIDYSVRNITR